MGEYGILIFIVLLVVIVSQFVHMRKTAQINEKLKQMVQDSNEQYQEVMKVNKSLKNIRHDINKQRTMVEALQSEAEIKELTGVSVIDRIIHFKGKESLGKNIRFTVDAKKLSSVDIGDGALISIFTNIFDNAIEACAGLNSPWIHCMICDNSHGNFHMTVSNSKSRRAIVETDNVVTTKQDKELHGYGLNIIKELVGRNGGTVSVEDKGDEFSLVVQV